MTPPIAVSIACPHCGVKLKVKDPSKFGKTVPCPQCQRPFVVTPPAAAPESALAAAEPAAEPAEVLEYSLARSEEPDPPPTPPVRRPVSDRPAAAGSRMRRDDDEDMEDGTRKLILWGAGIGGLAVLLLVAGGLYTLGIIGGDKKPADGRVAEAKAPPSPNNATQAPAVSGQSGAAAPVQPAAKPAPGIGQSASGTGLAGASPPPAATTPGAPTASAGSAATAPAGLDLAYLPPQAEAIVSIRPAELWKSPLVQAFQSRSWELTLARIEQSIGLAPRDVDRITWALETLPEQGSATPTALWTATPWEGGGGLPNATESNSIITVRLNRPADPQSLKLAENGFAAVQHQGRTLHVRSNASGSGFAVYPAAPSLLVLGPLTAVQGAIARGESAAPRLDLSFVEPDAQLLLVVAPRRREQLAQALPELPEGAVEAGPLAAAIGAQGRAFSLGIKAEGGLALAAAVACADSSGAAQVRDALLASVQSLRTAFDGMKEGLPAELVQVAELALGSVQAAEQAGVVRATSSVPDSARDMLVKLPEQITTMMITLQSRRIASQLTAGSAEPSAADDALFDQPADEGESQGPVTFDGIPEGISLVGKAAWEREPGTDVRGQPATPRLQVILELIGGAASEAAQFGKYKLTAAETDTGTRLTLQAPAASDHPARGFVRRDPDDPLAAHPPDGIRAVFEFKSPDDPFRFVATFEGALTLNVPGGSPQTATIPGARSRIGKPVEHPDLKRAGLQLRLMREDLNLALKVIKGNADRIGEAYPVDAAGTRIEGHRFVPAASAKDRKLQFLMVDSDELPEDFGLELVLFEGLEEVVIPFRFADLPVPERAAE